MLLALSPYHLTTREPAAMASLVLADRIITLIPTPASMGDAVSVRATAERVPRFVELIETWRWSTALWDAGLIASAFEGADARDDVSDVHQEILTRPELTDLRAMMSERGPGTDEAQLDAIAKDLLRAGPDPTISIPVAAGLDRFSARHGLVSVRASGHSMAQMAEARLADSCFRCAIPVLTQASADRVLEARESLFGELENLRDAIRGVMQGQGSGSVREAGSAYTEAFERERQELLRTEDDDTMPMVRAQTVVIEGVRLPLDAVLRSSVTAARKARGKAPPAEANGRVSCCETVLGVQIRVMGR